MLLIMTFFSAQACKHTNSVLKFTQEEADGNKSLLGFHKEQENWHVRQIINNRDIK